MNKLDKHISPHIASQATLLAEMECLYNKIAKFTYFLVVEEYSFVNKRIFLSIYNKVGIKLCACWIGFCYPMSDDEVYEELYNHLISVFPDEATQEICDTAIVIVPAHAASLLERINHADHGLQYAVPYSFVKDWDQFMKSKVTHEEIKFD